MALQPNDKRTLKKANLPFLRILYFKPASISHGILQYVSKQDETSYNTSQQDRGRFLIMKMAKWEAKHYMSILFL